MKILFYIIYFKFIIINRFNKLRNHHLSFSFSFAFQISIIKIVTTSFFLDQNILLLLFIIVLNQIIVLNKYYLYILFLIFMRSEFLKMIHIVIF